EEWWKPVLAKREHEREQAAGQAKADLAAYEKELAPKLEALEKERTERIAKTGEELKTYEATLPAKLAEWEKKQRTDVDWVRLNPRSLRATGNVKLTKQDDLSVFATGPVAKTKYTVV